MIINHFEELWGQCEQFHQQHNSNGEVSSLIEELMLKVNLYKALDKTPTDKRPEDFAAVKARAMGEILFTLTNLSLRDNIDVFGALSTALTHRY